MGCATTACFSPANRWWGSRGRCRRRAPARTPRPPACAWDPRFRGLSFYESTAIFSPARFRAFILDVKRLRNLNPSNFCGVDVYNGLLIRFVKTSDNYLGQPEDSVVVDFNYYRASDPSAARLNQDVWEEVVQLAFVKHGARPHWAKRQIDTRGLFDSQWSNEVVGGKELRKEDGCALDGRCVCSEDRHCSPSQGYYCRPGLVCRYSSSQLG